MVYQFLHRYNATYTFRAIGQSIFEIALLYQNHAIDKSRITSDPYSKTLVVEVYNDNYFSFIPEDYYRLFFEKYQSQGYTANTANTAKSVNITYATDINKYVALSNRTDLSEEITFATWNALFGDNITSGNFTQSEVFKFIPQIPDDAEEYNDNYHFDIVYGQDQDEEIEDTDDLNCIEFDEFQL